MARRQVALLAAGLVAAHWRPAGADSMILASCFPWQPDTVGLDFDCQRPASSTAPGDAVNWTYKDDPATRHRECLDEECRSPKHHVQLNWHGARLHEYNLSFSIRVFDMNPPELPGMIGLLSLGLGPVIAARPVSYFMDAPNDLGDGKFHDVEVRANRNWCDVLVDGVAITQVLGTNADPSDMTVRRVCGALGALPYGAIFGGHVTRTGRAIFSRTSGEVKNVVLRGEMPPALPAQGALASRGPDQEWSPGLAEAWSALEGRWLGRLRTPGGACSGRNGTRVLLCCADEVVEVDLDIRFQRNGQAMDPWMEMLVSGGHPGLVQRAPGYEVALPREKQVFPIRFDLAGSHDGVAVTARLHSILGSPGFDEEIAKQVDESMQEDACLHFRPMGDGRLWMSAVSFFSAVPLDDRGTKVVMQHTECPARYVPEASGCEPGAVRPVEDFPYRHNPGNIKFSVTALLTKMMGAPEEGSNQPSVQSPDGRVPESPQFGDLWLAAAGGAVGILICCGSLLCCFVYWRSRLWKLQKAIDLELGSGGAQRQQQPGSDSFKHSTDSTPSFPWTAAWPSSWTPGSAGVAAVQLRIDVQCGSALERRQLGPGGSERSPDKASASPETAA